MNGPIEEARNPCPVPACLRTMPSRFAVCKRHWDEAPSPIRKRVVDTYNAGAQARYQELWPTPEYLAAVNELVIAVVRQRDLANARAPA